MIIRESGEFKYEQDKKFQMLQKVEKTFFELGNVHGCNNGISSIHWK